MLRSKVEEKTTHIGNDESDNPNNDYQLGDMIDLDHKTITIKEIELIASDERFKKNICR